MIRQLTFRQIQEAFDTYTHNTLSHTLTHTLTRTHAHTHTHTHTHNTHSHTHTHTHTLSHRYAPSLPPLIEEPSTIPKKPSPEPEAPLSPPSSPVKRHRIGLPAIIHDPLFGGYDRGYGGLGLPTLLLRFKYKQCPPSVQRELDKQLLHK